MYPTADGVQALGGVPEANKQRIVAGAGSGATQTGIPKSAPDLPSAAGAMMETVFRGWFTDGMASTFVVAVILAVAGGLCAFALRSTAKEGAASAVAGPDYAESGAFEPVQGVRPPHDESLAATRGTV